MSGAASSGSREPNADGRRAKGERRRRALIDATFRVVERDGASGVSHRNIAREADVPPASIAYYFASIDDLLVATLLESVENITADIERVQRSVREDGVSWSTALARMLADTLNEHRGRTFAEYELYLLAGRRPALRPAARKWIDVAAGYINDGKGADPAIVRAFFAAIDGLMLHGLIADEPPTADDLEPTLHYLLQPMPYLQRIGELPPEMGTLEQ